MTGLDKSLKRKWRVFDIKGHYTSVPRKTLIKPKVPQNSNGIILFFSKKYFWFLFLFLFLFVFLMGVGRLGDTLVIEKKIFVSWFGSMVHDAVHGFRVVFSACGP